MGDKPGDHDIAELMREFDASDLAELHVRIGDFDLFLSKDQGASGPESGNAQGKGASPSARVAQSSASTKAAPPESSAEADPAALPDGMIGVHAPYLGTFYRAPKPGEANFVEIGDSVAEGRDLCLVEVMKLFTAVRAEQAGIVRHVYAVDGQMVEEGQLLFALDPAA